MENDMGTEKPDEYGSKGNKYKIGEMELLIDEEFIVATLLAIVSVLNEIYPKIDEQISIMGSGIYREITKTS